MNLVFQKVSVFSQEWGRNHFIQNISFQFCLDYPARFATPVHIGQVNMKLHMILGKYEFHSLDWNTKIKNDPGSEPENTGNSALL